MTESSRHTSKPQVEVEASGGDDNKSAHNESIHARWDRVMRKLGRTPQTPSAPTKPHPTNAVTVDPKKHAQKAPGTAKPAHKAYVRQTGDGIRVSPSALNKKKHPKSQ